MSLPNVLSRVLRRRASSRRRQQPHLKPAHRGRSFVPRLERLEDRTVLSTWTVANPSDSGDGSLRAVIAGAQSGDQIVFDGSLQGQTIILTSGPLAITQSLDIEGPGADQLAVSGNDTSRVFDISGGGLTVTLADLAIVHGLSSQGGGIDNAGSTLTVFRCIVSNNQAVGVRGGDGKGGGIFNEKGAVLTVTESMFIGNRATAGDGNNAKGGGLFNEAGATLTVAASTFFSNVATGKPSTSDIFRLDTFGGGMDNEGGATVRNTLFTHNQAVGGSGRAGSTAYGGGIFNGRDQVQVNAKLTVSHSVFTDNQALGGSGTTGQGGIGGGGAITNLNGATVVLDQSTLTGNRAVGGSSGSGYTGRSVGGGINNVNGARLTVSSCTLSENQAIGGAGSHNIDFGEALAAGGGIFSGFGSTAMVSETTLQNNQAIGGAGSAGKTAALGEGGGIHNAFQGATFTLSHCTLIGNRAIGGAGTAGGNGGVGWGGAMTNAAPSASTGAILVVSGCTLTGNRALGGAASGGGNGGRALGGGIVAEPGLSSPTSGASTTVTDTVLTDNQAIGGAASDGGKGGNGLGGGIYNYPGATLVVTGGTISGNQALGGDGATAGQGFGGGLYLADGRKVSVRDTTIKDNHASTSDDDVFEVQPGPATHFGISAPAHVTSGMGFDVTVTALDAFDHTAVRYRGTVSFTSSDTDPGVVLPTDYTFTTDDGGVHAFPGGFTLVTPGDQMLTAADMGDNTITGSAIVTVDPGPAAPHGGGARDPDQPAPFRGRYALADSVLVENRATTSDDQRVGRGPYLVHSGTASIKDTTFEDNHASTSDDDVFGDFRP
jgi:hypothetical protein